MTTARSVLILFFIAALPGVAFAQAVTIAPQPDPVQYSVSPDVPGPQTPVTITLTGVGDLIGNSQITWTVDGRTVQSGAGASTYQFTTGRLGQKTTVGVAIASPDQGTFRHSWTFNPSLANLVWEARTTVPPLYAGKALYSSGSQITVVSFPEVLSGGARVPDARLSFQWKLGGNPMPDQSGLGRSAFTFMGDQLHASETVDLDIMLGSDTVAHDEITIPAADPQIVFYEHDPLRGIRYERALGSQFTMQNPEITVHAEPYYFSSLSAVRGSLAWSWTINGSDTTGPNAAAGELTLRSQGAGQGTAVLGVALQNAGPTTFLQAAQASLSIVFGAKKPGTIFGI